VIVLAKNDRLERQIPRDNWRDSCVGSWKACAVTRENMLYAISTVFAMSSEEDSTGLELQATRGRK